MERTNFEPFGEAINPPGEVRAPSKAGKRLTMVGSGIFWILALTIVVARAQYFQPGIFDSFKQAIAFLH